MKGDFIIMSNFSMFMKSNKITKPNAFYAATKSLCDENGKPLEWEFKFISTKEVESIREECTKEVPLPGKNMMYRQKISSSDYIAKIICAATVTPDLYDAELQDSYDVNTPEELLYELVDNPGEYADLTKFIQTYLGFEDNTLGSKIEQAKN